MGFPPIGGGALSGVTVSGTASNGQVPVASSSSAGAWGFPPGFEFVFAQITAPVNVVSTTEATGTTIITAGAATFDGLPVICEFFAPNIVTSSNAAGEQVVVSLFEGATQIDELCIAFTYVTTARNSGAKYGRCRFTPSAASHTYTITAFTTNTTGTCTVTAGAGGAGVAAPAFMRITKV